MKLATLVYLKRNLQTLMLHRVKKANDYHEGKYNGLGGKLEPGESPEECAIRETREESGLELVDPILKGFITFPNFDGVDDWYVFLFVGTQFTGEMIDSPEGDLEWIDDDKLAGIPLWEGDYMFLSWLEGDRFFSAKFNYEDGRYIDHTVTFH
jgi:8-oxo-dGTP diphosphatase